MSNTSTNVVRICMGLAGLIFLGETLWGCIAVLGIGFDTTQEILFDLSLTMAFPIFLIAIRSKGVALVGLWLFFIAQWIEMGLIRHPPALLNPFEGTHGDVLFVGVILLTVAYILHRRQRPHDDE